MRLMRSAPKLDAAQEKQVAWRARMPSSSLRSARDDPGLTDLAGTSQVSDECELLAEHIEEGAVRAANLKDVPSELQIEHVAVQFEAGGKSGRVAEFDDLAAFVF